MVNHLADRNQERPLATTTDFGLEFLVRHTAIGSTRQFLAITAISITGAASALSGLFLPAARK